MGPENRMLNRLKPRLEKDIIGLYIEKTANPYRRGMPDWYVEWNDGSGWIEAKFRDIKTEGRETVQVDPIYDMLSAHQEKWLYRAQDKNIPAAILTGFPQRDTYAFFPVFIPPPQALGSNRPVETNLLNYKQLREAIKEWSCQYYYHLP